MAVVSEPPWVNKTSGTAARNGTTSHTISFGFTSTTGNLLVVIVSGDVTNTVSGWTEQLQPVDSGETSVFTKTSAADTSITVTHNSSNYPVHWVAYEFLAGSTYTSGTSTNNTASDTFPALGSLPGTAQVIIAARGRGVGSGGTAASSTWTAPWVEDADLFITAGATDGAYLTAGHQINVTATSITPAASGSYSGTGYAGDRQHVVFAINAAALGPLPSTVTGVAAVAAPYHVGLVPATVSGTTTIAAPTSVGEPNSSATVTVSTVAGTATIPAPIEVGAPNMPATVAGAVSVATPPVGLQRSVSTASTSTSVTGLLPGKTYTARVRAQDAAGNWSGWSTAIQFTTPAGTVVPATVAGTATVPAATAGGTPPTVVAGPARPVKTNGSVLLDATVTPPGGETIFAYSWTITSGGGSLANASTATPTYTAPNLGSGLVTVRVTAHATNGGHASADVTVSYHGTLVAAENALTGTARATWDLSSPNLGGVSTLQGFCDGYTINVGGTANFKIAQSDTAGWTADVYRLGYYAGNGARLYATLAPSGSQITASQAQPSPADADPDTTLLSADCAGWSTTLSWAPPAWAPSGVYLLRLNRTGGGASHIPFIVRDDARAADIMLMTADATWNAYNAWGGMGGSMYSGNSLYFGTAIDQYNADCAHYVSYNRPVVNRGAADSGRSYGAVAWSNLFTGEYPMIRFLERNGFDVKYYGGIDAGGDSLGTHLVGNGSTRGGAKTGMFVGHNEYWSDVMRAGWERAKNLGVNVFTCAGNEVFWRTVGTDPDSDGRPRLFECQKSTINGRGDTRPQWTGTWRDPDGAGKGGNSPEVSFTGSIFAVNGPDLRSLVVPFTGGYSAQPLWRNTSVAGLSSGSYTSPNQILGFEWDTYGSAGCSTTGATFMGAAHPRAVFCSDVTYTVSSFVLTDAGDVYGTGDVTHRLVVHPGGAGAVCFATGTINWALGLDNANTYQQGNDNTDTPIQQATINMLADMGAQPATVMSGLTAATLVDWYPDIVTSTVAAVASVAAPTVRIYPAATTVAGTTTVGVPTTSGTGLATPATVAGAATVGAAAAQVGSTLAAATVAGTASIGNAAIVTSSGTTVQPGTVAAATAVGGPAFTSQATAGPGTVPAVATVPASTPSTSIQDAAATVTATTTVGAATVLAGATATPAGVAGTTTVAAVTVLAGTATTPTTVVATVVVGTPQVSGQMGATATPTTVGAVTAVAAVTVVAVVTTSPATVAATVAVGLAAVLAGAAAAAQTVAGAASVPGVFLPVQLSASVPAVTVAATATVGMVVAGYVPPLPWPSQVTTTSQLGTVTATWPGTGRRRYG